MDGVRTSVFLFLTGFAARSFALPAGFSTTGDHACDRLRAESHAGPCEPRWHEDSFTSTVAGALSVDCAHLSEPADMQAEQNELITRIGPGTACGALMRSYWQPVALLDEFDPRHDPRMAHRPVKAVRLLGQDLVLFRDGAGPLRPARSACPHRGADLAFGRHEPDGLRCPFHGWKFAADGRCLETPAEPVGSTLCQRVRPRSYPVRERRRALRLAGAEGSSRPSCRVRLPSPRRPATASPSRACGTATGCRPSRSASTRRIRRSCTATCRTSSMAATRPTAASSAPPAPARSAASAGR